jgi:hypothetical protein
MLDVYFYLIIIQNNRTFGFKSKSELPSYYTILTLSDFSFVCMHINCKSIDKL